jgi:hypothetical protein
MEYHGHFPVDWHFLWNMHSNHRKDGQSERSVRGPTGCSAVSGSRDQILRLRNDSIYVGQKGTSVTTIRMPPTCLHINFH